MIVFYFHCFFLWCYFVISLQQDEKATAEVYKEFVASFDDAGKLNKTWIKGGTFNPEKSSSTDPICSTHLME